MATTTTQLAIPTWTLPDRLRKAREFAGLEQAELADEIGIGRNSVGNYERGRTHPRKIVLRAWAMRCGVPVDWLESGESSAITGEPAG